MNNSFKSIFMTLMLTLALTFVFSQKVVTLKIADDGQLSLEGDIRDDTTDLESYSRIRWEIADGELGIDGFRIEAKSPGEYYPMGSSLDRSLRKTVPLRTKLFPRETTWSYAIVWKDSSGGMHRLDPKIAVKPGFVPILLISLAGLCATIFGVIAFRKRKQVKSIVYAEKK